MGEHSSWGATLFHVHALLGPSLDWSLDSWTHKDVRLLDEAFPAFKQRGVKEGWLPPPRPLPSSWASAGRCAADVAMPQLPGQQLHVAVGTLHHGEFQEFRALLERALERYTNAPTPVVEPLFIKAKRAQGALS